MACEWDQPCSVEDLFAATAGPLPPPLITNLIPWDGTVLLHGQPREGKSLIALELCVALATGTAAFASSRLRVAGPAPVLYVAAEDPPERVAERLHGMLLARGLAKPPGLLKVLFPRELTFDTDGPLFEFGQRCIEDDVRLVVFDPVGRLTKFADQGPSEFQPVADRLKNFRRLINGAIALVHHDIKPDRKARDRRQLPHLASGGASSRHATCRSMWSASRGIASSSLRPRTSFLTIPTGLWWRLHSNSRGA